MTDSEDFSALARLAATVLAGLVLSVGVQAVQIAARVLGEAVLAMSRSIVALSVAPLEFGGFTAAVVALLAAVVVIAVVNPGAIPIIGRDRIDEGGALAETDDPALDAAHRAYVEGEIGDIELDRRIEAALADEYDVGHETPVGVEGDQEPNAEGGGGS